PHAVCRRSSAFWSTMINSKSLWSSCFNARMNSTTSSILPSVDMTSDTFMGRRSSESKNALGVDSPPNPIPYGQRVASQSPAPVDPRLRPQAAHQVGADVFQVARERLKGRHITLAHDVDAVGHLRVAKTLARA